MLSIQYKNLQNDNQLLLHDDKCNVYDFFADPFNKSNLLLRSFKSTLPAPPPPALDEPLPPWDVGLITPAEEIIGCRQRINTNYSFKLHPFNIESGRVTTSAL